MSKKNTSANQDHYKVGGNSPFPDRYQIEVSKRKGKNESVADAAKTATDAVPKDPKPGRKAHSSR